MRQNLRMDRSTKVCFFYQQVYFSVFCYLFRLASHANKARLLASKCFTLASIVARGRRALQVNERSPPKFRHRLIFRSNCHIKKCVLLLLFCYLLFNVLNDDNCRLTIAFLKRFALGIAFRKTEAKSSTWTRALSRISAWTRSILLRLQCRLRTSSVSSFRRQISTNSRRRATLPISFASRSMSKTSRCVFASTSSVVCM